MERGKRLHPTALSGISRPLKQEKSAGSFKTPAGRPEPDAKEVERQIQDARSQIRKKTKELTKAGRKLPS